MKHLLRKFFLILQQICFASIHIVKNFVKHTFGQTLKDATNRNMKMVRVPTAQKLTLRG